MRNIYGVIEGGAWFESPVAGGGKWTNIVVNKHDLIFLWADLGQCSFHRGQSTLQDIQMICLENLGMRKDICETCDKLSLQDFCSE